MIVCRSADANLCRKHKSEYLDPCQEAAARSIRCLHRNGGDKALCQDYFQCVLTWPFPCLIIIMLRHEILTLIFRAYRECKKQWVSLDASVAEQMGGKTGRHGLEELIVHYEISILTRNSKKSVWRTEEIRSRKRAAAGLVELKGI